MVFLKKFQALEKAVMGNSPQLWKHGWNVSQSLLDTWDYYLILEASNIKCSLIIKRRKLPQKECHRLQLNSSYLVKVFTQKLICFACLHFVQDLMQDKKINISIMQVKLMGTTWVHFSISQSFAVMKRWHSECQTYIGCLDQPTLPDDLGEDSQTYPRQNPLENSQFSL